MILKFKFAKTKNDFDEKFKKSTTNALMKTGYRILKEAHYLAPIDHGALVGSGYVQVGKDLKFNPNKEEADNDNPPNPNNDNKDLEMRVGYSVPYAAQLHENKFNPGAKSIQKGLTYPGYKWLSKATKKINTKELFKEFLQDEFE
jgi:hypothetical protein